MAVSMPLRSPVNAVYVGGSFRGFGGQARNRLAAFNLVTKEVFPGTQT